MKSMIIIGKGQKICHEEMIGIMTSFLMKHLTFNYNLDMQHFPEDRIFGDEQYFEGDANYEIIIRKKHKQRKE